MQVSKTVNHEYDYENQAWTVDGKYVRCEHPESVNCKCYGKLHEGEPIKSRETVSETLGYIESEIIESLGSDITD